METGIRRPVFLKQTSRQSAVLHILHTSNRSIHTSHAYSYVWGHIIPILTVLTISEVGPHSTWPRNMAWPCGAGCGLNGTIWVCLKIEYPQFQWIISMFPLKKWQFIGILYFQANPCSKHFVPQPHVPMRETNLYTLQDHTSSSQLAEVRET